MSEEQHEEDSVEHVGGTTTVEPVYDYYLMVQAKLLDTLDEDSSIGMSLNVAGGMVSGLLISRATWEKRWVAEVAAADENLGEILESVVGALDEHENSKADSEPEPNRFVHMKDAMFISGSTRLDLGLWRAPMAQIAGWSNAMFKA
ncbi:hypothetical protein [Streptomyces sp. NPDC059759]|uniref:hypothetical protein n=1 Tax=Streptomyces sp. NPDC059759 TaxID=3346936 RepID=UPI00365F88BA